jgi:hypothetical protein
MEEPFDPNDVVLADPRGARSLVVVTHTSPESVLLTSPDDLVELFGTADLVSEDVSAPLGVDGLYLFRPRKVGIRSDGTIRANRAIYDRAHALGADAARSGLLDDDPLYEVAYNNFCLVGYDKDAGVLHGLDPDLMRSLAAEFDDISTGEVELSFLAALRYLGADREHDGSLEWVDGGYALRTERIGDVALPHIYEDLDAETMRRLGLEGALTDVRRVGARAITAAQANVIYSLEHEYSITCELASKRLERPTAAELDGRLRVSYDYAGHELYPIATIIDERTRREILKGDNLLLSAALGEFDLVDFRRDTKDSPAELYEIRGCDGTVVYACDQGLVVTCDLLRRRALIENKANLPPLLANATKSGFGATHMTMMAPLDREAPAYKRFKSEAAARPSRWHRA